PRGGPTGVLRLYDTTTGQICAVLSGLRESSLRGCRFAPASPRGSILAVADEVEGCRRVRLLELPTFRTLATLDGATGPLTFSPDGRRLSAGLRPMVYDQPAAAVWDVAAAAMTTRIGSAPSDEYVTDFALTPDGRQLAVSWEFPRMVGSRAPDVV